MTNESAVEGLCEAAERIPGTYFLIIRGVGHTAYREVPDHFNRIVDSFLRSESKVFVSWRANQRAV